MGCCCVTERRGVVAVGISIYSPQNFRISIVFINSKNTFYGCFNTGYHITITSFFTRNACGFCSQRLGHVVHRAAGYNTCITRCNGAISIYFNTIGPNSDCISISFNGKCCTI